MRQPRPAIPEPEPAPTPVLFADVEEPLAQLPALRHILEPTAAVTPPRPGAAADSAGAAGDGPTRGGLAPAPLVPAPAGRFFEVSIGAIFKEESRFLVEWLEYHLLIGVEHFFMVGNDCADAALASRSVLAPYVRSGAVEYFSEYECAPRGFQNEAYTFLLRRSAGRTEWLMIVDIDEFIVIPDNSLILTEALRPYEAYDAVALLWRLFGTSGHVHSPAGAVLKNYQHRATVNARDSRARSFKSIVRPAACLQMATHMCALFRCQLRGRVSEQPAAEGAAERARAAHCACTTSTDLQHCMSEDYLSARVERPAFTRLWMNHYRTKSHEDWERKKARGRASVQESAKDSKRTGPPPEEYNKEHDDTLYRSVKARLDHLTDQAEAGRLRAILLAGEGPRIGGRGSGGGGGSKQHGSGHSGGGSSGGHHSHH